MGFGKDMKGKASHEAIVRIQDAELRLLDTLHHFIIVRIDNDKKYVTGLGKMLNANKSDSSEFKECCTIFKVSWHFLWCQVLWLFKVFMMMEADVMLVIMLFNLDFYHFSSLFAISHNLYDLVYSASLPIYISCYFDAFRFSLSPYVCCECWLSFSYRSNQIDSCICFYQIFLSFNSQVYSLKFIWSHIFVTSTNLVCLSYMST